MKYNKLVRDKIPEYIKSKGGNPASHIASADEYWQKLKEKLQEEVSEFSESESVEEFVDLLEILDAIKDHKEFGSEALDELRKKKAEERGEFKNRVILEEA